MPEQTKSITVQLSKITFDEAWESKEVTGVKVEVDLPGLDDGATELLALAQGEAVFNFEVSISIQGGSQVFKWMRWAMDNNAFGNDDHMFFNVRGGTKPKLLASGEARFNTVYESQKDLVDEELPLTVKGGQQVGTIVASVIAADTFQWIKTDPMHNTPEPKGSDLGFVVEQTSGDGA